MAHCLGTILHCCQYRDSYEFTLLKIEQQLPTRTHARAHTHTYVKRRKIAVTRLPCRFSVIQSDLGDDDSYKFHKVAVVFSEITAMKQASRTRRDRIRLRLYTNEKNYARFPQRMPHYG